jgi:hypothetical protein
MEQLINYTPTTPHAPLVILPQPEEGIKVRPFIEANTEITTLGEIKREHIIPVFVKDNEPLISHSEFIESTLEIASDVFNGELISFPEIRVSHPVKGRIPEAKDKPAVQLMDWEKTLYYERMAFIIEVPSIQDNIDGNPLSLTIGGVKAYNQDNLNSKSMSEQHFKFFIGFKNTVCTNLCVWTDGYLADLRIKNTNQLKSTIRALMESYNQQNHLQQMKILAEYSLTERQFAQMVGRCRMYNHLPGAIKAEIPPLLFGDQQISNVVKDFYRNESFCRDHHGNINLWRLYNLFTGANKSTYIDNFLDRSVNASQLAEQLKDGLENRSENWYLN